MQEQSQEGETVVSFTHGRKIICSQPQMEHIGHEQTIIC